MLDMENMSNEELRNIRDGHNADDYDILSNEELKKIAGPQPEAGSNLGAFALGIPKGIFGVAENLGRWEAKGVDKLFGSHFADNTPSVQFSDHLEKILKDHPKSAYAGDLLGSVVAVPGLGELGGASKLGRVAGKTAGALLGSGKKSKAAVKLVDAIVKSGATGALTSPLYNSQDNLLDTMKTGAELGAAFPLAGKALGSTLGGSKRLGQKAFSSLVGGTNTPAEISKNIEALETVGVDKKMPIGTVVDSPTMHGLTALTADIPGSRQARNMMEVGKKTRSFVKDTMKEIKPEKGTSLSDDSTSFINDLRKGRRKEREIANKNFNRVDEVAKKAGVSFDKKEIQDVGREVIKEISGTPLEDDKSLKDILSSVIENESSPIFGTRLKKQSTFKEAFDLRKDLNQALSDTPFDDKQKIRHLTRLKNSVDSSLLSSSIKSGNPEITSLLKKANKHYRDNVVPLNQREISNFVDLGADPDKFIGTFLKTGKYDRDNLLNNVAKHLSGENKGKFIHRYLNASSREILGEERVKSGRILNDYMKLPNNAKKLLTDSVRKKFDSAYRVKEMGGGDLTQMINFKTGKSWSKAMGYAASLTVIAPVMANMLTRVLKSPKTRDSYMKALKTGSTEHLPVEFKKLLKLSIPLAVKSQRNDEDAKR